MRLGVLSVLLLAAAVGAGFVGGRLSVRDEHSIQAVPENVYDRVIRTGTLRCGYALWPPTAVLKDANSGKLDGIFVRIAEAVADNLSLKLEWTEETGWGTYIEALHADRFDLFCAPLWVNGGRGRRISYTVPIAFSSSHFYARKGDTRFDRDLTILNAPDYRLATMDGEYSAMVAQDSFPRAQTEAIPEFGDITQLFLAVATRKAHGVFSEPSLAKAFADKNPGSLRQVTTKPFGTFPNTFGMKIGETKLKEMIDSALTELLHRGDVDRIIESYESDRSIFMPVAKPYVSIEPVPLR